MSNVIENVKPFRWYPKDIELFQYFKDEPFFSVKYKRTAESLDKRKDFIDVCNKAAQDLSRLKARVQQKMKNVILKYAKLNLLISSGLVSEDEVRTHRCSSVFVKGKLDFMKVFVSGFTDSDIPQQIHNLYDKLFKVNAFNISHSEVTIEIVETYMNRMKGDSENDLQQKDIVFVNNAMRQSFKGFDDVAVPGYETRMYQEIGIPNYDVKKNPYKYGLKEVSFTVLMDSLLPTIKNKIVNSAMDIIENSVSEAIEDDTLGNNIPNKTHVAKPPESTCTVYSHKNIKKENNDNEMDIDSHSDSNAIEGNTLKYNSHNHNYEAEPSESTSSAALLNINIKKELNDSDIDIVEHGVSHSILRDTLLNSVPNFTYGAKTEKTLDLEPNVIIKTERNDSEIDIIRHEVSDVEDSFINNTPNVTSGVDLNKYMEDIAELLCKRLPKEKRREFLNQIDQIVSKILEE